LTATDLAGNSASSSFTLNWDQETPSVTSINVPAGLITTTFFKAGTQIPINVTFAKNAANPTASSFSLAVTGAPTLPLSTDGSALYDAANSTSKMLRFNYTVGTNDFSDLQAGGLLNLASSATSIALNGGTIRDNTGTFNNAKLDGLPYSSTNGIRTNATTPATITIDTVAPVVGFTNVIPTGESKNLNATFNTFNSGSGAGIAADFKDTNTVLYTYVSGSATNCVGATYTGPLAATSNFSASLSDRTKYPDGTATLCALGTDLAGNAQLTPSSATWTIDTTAPAALSITSPTSGQQFATQPVTVNWGSVAGDVEHIELLLSTKSDCSNTPIESYTIDGSNSIPKTAVTRTLSSSNLADGLYYVCMYTYDTAKNKSTMSSTSFEIETDMIHVSWTDGGGIQYGKKDKLSNWVNSTVVTGATYRTRSSLALNSNNSPVISYHSLSGSTSAMRTAEYLNGSWTETHDAQPGQSSANASVPVGDFNDLAINSTNTYYAVFRGIASNAFRQILVTNEPNQNAKNYSTMGTITDMSLAISNDDSQYTFFAAQNGLYWSNFLTTNPNTIGMPISGQTTCSQAVYVSSMASTGTNLGLSVACIMSDNSCKAFFATSAFSGAVNPTWTELGTIMASGCSLGALSEGDRPSVVYDRVKAKWSVAWLDKDASTIKRWSQEANGNENVVSGSVSEQTIAVDKAGKTYIIYKDGDTVKMITNNGRDAALSSGGWGSISTIISGSGVTGVGNIGISGMKGRSNTSGGQ
jgi:hypothetical protein